MRTAERWLRGAVAALAFAMLAGDPPPAAAQVVAPPIAAAADPSAEPAPVITGAEAVPTASAAVADDVPRRTSPVRRVPVVAEPESAPAPPVPAAPIARATDTVRVALTLSLMALLPALVVCTTSFTRFVVVLSMIRHGLGMPETPPNQVLVSLALFLTLFTMAPTFEALNTRTLQPFLAGEMALEEAGREGAAPLRDFMLRQVRDQDLRAVYDMAREPLPARAADVPFLRIVPAFMLNELRVAFRIGFVILLPFLLIDIVVSSILLALGMLMVPPSTLSLPIKVLMFVLIDGWSLVLQGVAEGVR